MTERVRETDTKHESREWRQKRERKRIRVIHQSQPSDNSTACLHFLPPVRTAALTWEGKRMNLLPFGVSGCRLVRTGNCISDCHHGD